MRVRTMNLEKDTHVFHLLDIVRFYKNARKKTWCMLTQTIRPAS